MREFQDEQENVKINSVDQIVRGIFNTFNYLVKFS